MHYFIKAFYGKLNLIPHLLKTNYLVFCSVSLCELWSCVRMSGLRPARRPPTAEQHSLAFLRGTSFLGQVYFVCLLLAMTQKLEFLLYSSIQELGKCPATGLRVLKIIWNEDLAADISTADTPQTPPGCEGFLSLWKKCMPEMRLPHHQK